MTADPPGRIRFANQLRGVAALGVVCSHWIGVYWILGDVVSAVTATPPQEGAVPAAFVLVSNPWLNPGPLGVAVFFLISGMVVPFSLERHTRLGFLAARLLRVFPTYLCALLIGVGAVVVSGRYWDRPLPFDGPTLWGNITLTYDLRGQASIDLVNWTLSVELKFYLLVAALAPAFRGGGLWAVFAVAAAVLAGNAALAAGWVGDITAPPSSISYTASSHSLCVLFMLIGTAFHFHGRGQLRTDALVGTAILLAAVFVGTWRLSVWRAQYPVVTGNYLLALLAFSTLYALRRRIPANWLLDRLAAISFPVYVLHSLLGFVVLRLCMVALHLPYGAAIPVAALVVGGAATALHLLVERPTQRWGRRIGLNRRHAR